MKKKIFALGFFDGVHLGHQALLAQCVKMARAADAKACAITFEQHPQSLFLPCPPGLIQTLADRKALLLSLGMDEVCALPVSEEIMSTGWQVFLEQLLQDGAAGFVCGSDFRFGCRGEGTAEKLQAFCAERALSCVIVPEQTVDGIRVSSTHIRELIERGDMAAAVRLLGHPHILSGEVMPGRQLGRTIGVPTANLVIPEGVVVPRLGVYACRAVVDGRKYPAVTNIGSRPTVGGHQVRAESWLQDFDGDLYGKQLTLEFLAFLRPEERFASLEALKDQIRRDAAQTRTLLSVR